jgi:hypothetical protein
VRNFNTTRICRWALSAVFFPEVLRSNRYIPYITSYEA